MVNIINKYNLLNTVVLEKTNVATGPPWINNDKIMINLNNTKNKKQQTNKEIYKQNHLAEIEKYKERKKIYIDGSKINNETGFAFIDETIIFQKHIPGCTT